MNKKTIISIAILSLVIIALIGVIIGMKVDNSKYKRYKNIISQKIR